MCAHGYCCHFKCFYSFSIHPKTKKYRIFFLKNHFMAKCRYIFQKHTTIKTDLLYFKHTFEMKYFKTKTQSILNSIFLHLNYNLQTKRNKLDSRLTTILIYMKRKDGKCPHKKNSKSKKHRVFGIIFCNHERKKLKKKSNK